MTAYYNEIDPYAAKWLRNLIAAGHIPPGDVDERSITDVKPSDLDGHAQCHFFAGIGGWAHALRLAGWPDDRPVWTGSCPCQPFSVAGTRKGTDDERHLWPAFRWLIAQRRPATVFGEQSASAAGRGWLAGVRADLEAMGYAVGAADLCAAGAGAPHIRQRLWWVADAAVNGGQRVRRDGGRPSGTAQAGPKAISRGTGAGSSCTARGLADSKKPGLEGHAGHGIDGCEPRWKQTDEAGHATLHGALGFWDAYDVVPCRDGEARRIEPGTFPLATGVPARVGKLRAYGNSIVPQVAQIWIETFAQEPHKAGSRHE